MGKRVAEEVRLLSPSNGRFAVMPRVAQGWVMLGAEELRWENENAESVVEKLVDFLSECVIGV